MKCKKCGNEIKKEFKFCSNCGNKLKPNYINIIGVNLIAISFLFFIYNAFIYKANSVLNKTNDVIKKENDDLLTRQINTTEKEVLYDQHKIIIPSNFTYKLSNNVLSILPSDDSWYCNIEISKGNFQKIVENKEMTKQHFIESGYIIGNYGIVKGINIEWLTYELNNDPIKCLVGYTKLNSVETIGFVLKSNDNSYNYEALNQMEEIIRNIR